MTGVSPVQSQAEALSLAPAGLKAYAALETLPDDILTHVLDELDLGTLARLEGVSRAISEKIHALGWPSYVLRHPISHVSLEPSSTSWPASILARHNTFIERSVRRRRWHAVQVGQTWNQPAIPVMKVAADRMVLGVGGKLVVHPFDPPLSRGQNQVGQRRGGKVIGPPREYALARRDQGSGADIMGIIPLSGGQYGVGQYDGTLQRISLPDLPSSNGARPGGGGAVRSTAHYPHPKGSNLHTLTATGTPEDDLMMSSTSAGLISIFNARSPWLSPGTFELPSTTRAWSSLLTSPTSSNGFNALIGTGSGISIYTLHPSGSSASPNTTQPIRYLFGPEAPASSSAYSLTLPPSPSTASRSITHHPSTLLSSWYDSHLRLHDLRSRSTSPVASFSDPYAWADGSAMYCATFLGENWIAGGGARHGAVCIFDVRWPNKGWSAFSPGGKGSPVYALQGDGGRLWGVSEKRAFVLAFDGSADPVYENIRGGVVESGVPVDEYGGQQDPSMVQHGSEGSSVTGMFGEGLIHPHARVRPAKVEERVSGWKGRGGKWSWTVRYRPDDQQSQQSRAAGSQIGSGREWDIGKAGHSVSINDGARPLISGASNDAAAPEPSLPRDAEGKVVGEGVIGYDHADRSVNLFDSVPVPYSPLPAGDHRDDDGSRNRSKGSRGGSRGRGGLRGGYRGRGS